MTNGSGGRPRLVISGPQGAGKGTQGDRLARWFRVQYVETGKMLRSAVRDGSPLGIKASEYMERGELVPDDLVVAMLEELIASRDAGGFVMDGFPRTIPQAEALDQMLDANGGGIDAVISIEVPDEILMDRLTNRWTCPTCGRVYNTTDHQPIEPGRCNDDGTELVRRADDNPDAIGRRLELFHKETKPVIAFYEQRDQVLRIDGVGRIEEVQARIVNALASRGIRRP